MMGFFRKHPRAGQNASSSTSPGVCAAVPSAVLPSCILPGARPELAEQLGPMYTDVGA